MAEELSEDEVNETTKSNDEKVPQNINELISFIDDGYKSEGELDTRKMVAEMNRKKKKSGGFQSMGLSHSIFKGVMKKGYKIPTPIQRKCIPLIMSEKDVVAMARTGSGKTAAFLIPMFEKLQARNTFPGARALLLSPTRELALQTLQFVRELGRFTDLRTVCVLGGDKMDDQFAALHENPDIIIATPGRLMHILVEMELRLFCIQYVVFDEADRLFELGFQEHLHEILRRLPEDRQTLLFSATLPKQLVEFAKAGLNDPTLVRLDVDTKLSEQLKLAFLHIRHEDKVPALLYLLQNVCKEHEQTVVFVATKHHVEYLIELLRLCRLSCSYVYSSLDMMARKINMAKFRNKTTKILIVTDVAARGLDIPMLDNVINVSFPFKPKLFVHRVGRVARAGRTGTAYSLVCPDELAYVIDLHLFLGRPLNFAKTGQQYQAWDSVYGSVAQVTLDEENATLQSVGKGSDIESSLHVAENAYKQYIRSRPAASHESIKRAKEILQTTSIEVHPLYTKRLDSGETARLKLLSSMKDYKPTATIFEIGATTKSTCSIVMKKTRKRNTKFIEKFREKLKSKQRANISMSSKHQKQNALVTTEEADEADIKNTFETVVKPSSSREFTVKKKKYRSRNQTFKDEEFYIDYKPKDFHTESGLSVNKSDKNFSKEASHHAMDIMGDEDVQLRKRKALQKIWDRKRKRFVNASDLGRGTPKKKIRTESGAVISATYKKNLYDEWRKKSKIDEQTKYSGMADGLTRRHRGPQNKGVNWNVRSELKRPEQILKERKLKEKERSQQKGRRRKKR